MDIRLDSCICRSPKTYIPRWRRATKNANTMCIIEGCKNPVDKVTKVVSRSQVSDLFKLPPDFPECGDDGGIALCVEHYRVMYQHIHPMKSKCRTCNKKITDATKSRSCPNPVLVQNVWNKIQNRLPVIGVTVAHSKSFP